MADTTAYALEAPSRSPSAPKAFRNSALLTSYAVFDAGLLFLTTLVLTRYLPVADFGKIAFGMSYGTLLFAISDPGISLTIQKFVARDTNPESEYLRDGLSLRFASIVVVGILATLPFLFSSYLRGNVWVLLPVIFSEHIRGATASVNSIFRAFQSMQYEVLAVATERIATLTLVWTLLETRHGLTMIAGGMLAGRLIAFLLAFLVLRYRFNVKHIPLMPSQAPRILKDSVPLGTLVLAERINLYYAPLALTAIVGEYASGLFTAAFKVVSLPLMLTGTVAGSLFPAMSAAHEQHDKVQKYYRFGVRVLWHMLLPAAVVTLVFAPQVMRTLFGPRYEPAAPILRLLTPYYLIYAMMAIGYYLMPAVNQQKTTLRLSMVSLVLNIVGGPLFMMRFGVDGAAIGLVVTNLVVALSYAARAARMGYHLMRLREDFMQWGGFVLTAIASLLLRHFVLVQHWYELALVCCGVVIVYGLMLLWTDGLLPEEARLLSSVKQWLSRSPQVAPLA